MMRKFIIPACLAFIVGFAAKGILDLTHKTAATGPNGIGYWHSSDPTVRGVLNLAFSPGDRVIGTNYHGEQKIENAVGTVVGINYNPVWHDDKEIWYWVEFDGESTKDGHCASGKKASELKLAPIK